MTPTRRIDYAVAVAVLHLTVLLAPLRRAHAQPSNACRTTVADVVQSLRGAATVTRFAERSPQAANLFLARIDTLEREYAGSFVYNASAPNAAQNAFRLVAKHRPTWRAHRDRDLAVPGVYDSLQATLFLTLGAALDSAGADTLRNPLRCVVTVLRREALDVNLETLRRFERKFGPESVRLNALEVLVNYGLQFVPWPPLVGVDASGSPRPWEAVVAYRTTYLTVTGLRGGGARPDPAAVSVAEFGLRHYNFGERWGTGSGVLERLLFPGHWAAGVLVASDENGAMANPWRAKPRVGPYVAWGTLKVGWLTGRDRRVVVSREVMLVPYVF